MLRFHIDSSVSSIGADEAMPALETRMSMPPIFGRGEGERVDDVRSRW